MEAQGYPLSSNMLYQDIQGEIHTERNGHDSFTAKYFHVHMRYFFLKDKQENGDFSINYFPTWKNFADYLQIHCREDVQYVQGYYHEMETCQ